MFMRACVCGSRSRSKRNLVTGDLKAGSSPVPCKIVILTATARRMVVVDRGGRGVKVIK